MKDALKSLNFSLGSGSDCDKEKWKVGMVSNNLKSQETCAATSAAMRAKFIPRRLSCLPPTSTVPHFGMVLLVTGDILGSRK